VVSVAGGSMAAFAPGYLIDKWGITVGLTEANTAGMAFTDLPARDPVAGSGGRTPTVPMDFAALPACIALNGTAPCHVGTALMDTGVGQGYLRLPIGAPLGRDPVSKRLYDGSTVSVALGQPAVVTEAFTVGSGAATGVTPAYVEAYNSRRGNFFNSGRHAYRAWVTAYDAVSGRLGFRAV